MARLIAAVIYYEEAWTLERCLTSIRRAAPAAHIVAIDGAYEQFPHPKGPESSDDSNAIADRLANEVIRCPDGKAWPSEIAKRCAYLRLGQEGDTFLVVDADEEVFGLVPEIADDEMNVRFERDDGTPPGINLRFFKYRSGMRYEGTHHALWVGDRLLNSKQRATSPGFWILHHYVDRGLRNARRMKPKAIYYRWLEKEEQQFRSGHVLV
jgi:hypothetical protein